MPTDSDFQRVTDDSLTRIDEIYNIALDLKAEALSYVTQLHTAAAAHINTLNSETFAPIFDGLSLGFSPPSTATEPSFGGLGPAPPNISVPASAGSFSYTDSGYTPLLQSTMSAKFTSVIGGALIVPTAIWDDVYQRALEKVTAQKLDDEWAAQNLGASLGWSLPSESTLAGLEEAQDEGAKKALALIVERSIAEAKERHADLWKAMELGNTFEGVWIGHHHQTENRALQAAQAAITSAIDNNRMLIASADLQLKEYGLVWETAFGYLKAETDRFAVRLQEAGIELDSEKVRQTYEELKLRKGLEIEKGEVALAVEKAKLAEVLVTSLTEIANMISAMTQGALAASDVSVGASTSYSYGESLTL